MIGYVTLGTNDLPKAARFYDAILAELGARRFIETEKWISWGNPGGAGIMVTKPHDGRAASVGNGVMVALAARDRIQVDRIHQLAMTLGARDEGRRDRAANDFMPATFAIWTETNSARSLWDDHAQNASRRRG